MSDITLDTAIAKAPEAAPRTPPFRGAGPRNAPSLNRAFTEPT